jgi:uncharacterized protein involved in exopolysaccharide biosynthesis
VVTAAIVSLRAPKVYEITSTIQLGNVNGAIISNEDAKAIIMNQNSLYTIINDLDIKGSPESLQKAIKITDIAGTSLLKLKLTYTNVDLSLKINDAIVNPFIAQGQVKFQERLAVVNERLKELDNEINNSEIDINRTQALISGLPNASGVSQSDVSLRIILLQNTLPAYESNLTTLRDQRNKLKLMVIEAKDFKVFDAPIKPGIPVGPNKKKNVIIAGMLSLIFGVFLAFVLEFWQKSKK